MGRPQSISIANSRLQQKCGALDELNSKFFVNDKQNPYTTDESKPFLWIRGRQVRRDGPSFGAASPIAGAILDF